MSFPGHAKSPPCYRNGQRDEGKHGRLWDRAVQSQELLPTLQGWINFDLTFISSADLTFIIFVINLCIYYQHWKSRDLHDSSPPTSSCLESCGTAKCSDVPQQPAPSYSQLDRATPVEKTAKGSGRTARASALSQEQTESLLASTARKQFPARSPRYKPPRQNCSLLKLMRAHCLITAEGH